MRRTLSNVSLRTKGKNDYYYARLTDPSRSPKRTEVALRTRRKRIARKRATHLEEQYERGEIDPWTRKPRFEHLTVEEAVEQFLNAKAGTVRDSTLRTYRQQLEAWLTTCPPALMLKALHSEHLYEYIHEYTDPSSPVEHLSNATRRKRYRHVRTFVNWLQRTHHIHHNPLDDVQEPERETKLPTYLSRSELERLLCCIRTHGETVTDAAGKPSDVQWLLDIIRVAVCTGLRRSELVNLHWDDVDLRKRCLTVRNRSDFKTKNGHERVVPLRSDALGVIERRSCERPAHPKRVFTDRQGRVILPGRVSHRFKFFVRKAKLHDRERLHFHSLRHTCGTWLTASGVPLHIIQKILGHADAATTQIYAQVQDDVMGEALERTFGQ